MDPSTVTRGMRVRCIRGYDVYPPDMRGQPPVPYEDLSWPKHDKVYTVREVAQTWEGKGLLFWEIQNRRVKYDVGGWQEPCFTPDRFEIATNVCEFCEQVHGSAYENAPYVADGKAVCSDFWFDAIGKEIDEHPIGVGRRPHGC